MSNINVNALLLKMQHVFQVTGKIDLEIIFM